MSSRNKKFRQLVVETLENRELLSVNGAFDPSPEALELLDRINRMRVDPQGELSRIFSDLERGIANDSRINSYFGAYAYPTLARLKREFADLTSVAPLAWDNALTAIASEHTALMINRGEQTHQFDDELSLEQRMINAGVYDPASGLKLDFAENITAYGRQAVENGYGSVASFIHEFLVIDFGNPSHEHRNNVMDPNLTYAGIGLQQVPNGTVGFGPWVATIDFASVSNGAQFPEGGNLVGLVFDDFNGNYMYDVDEGLGGMQVVIQQNDSIVTQFDTSSAGAFQQYLENGTYAVTISGSAFAKPLTQMVVIDGQNVKVDFRPQDAGTPKPMVDVNGSAEGIHYNVHFPETVPSASLVAPGLTVQSVGMLSYAVVQLQNRPDGNYEILQVDASGTGLATRYDSATGTLTISGTATTADYAKVLQTLSYWNNLERPHLEERLVSVVVSNGFQESTAAMITAKMDAVYIPTMTIEDVKVIEGDEGVTDLVFTVELSELPREMIVINYEVVAGTAEAGKDFTPQTGRIVFNLWEQTTATITIPVTADYDPGEDRTVLLNILNATNVDLARSQFVGTILEDDNVTNLGRMPSWGATDLEFADGRRLLYSFEAMYDGTISWDTVLDSLPEGTRMVAYLNSHSTIPIAYSTLNGDKQHLEMEVVEGTTYVVKIEGRDEVDPELLPGIVSTRMVQTVRIVDDAYEILGNVDRPSDFVVDFSGDEILVGYDDALTRINKDRYSQIFFNLWGGDNVTIIGGGSKDDPIVVKPSDEYLIIDGVELNVTGLKNINFAGTDGYDSVNLIADGGDSHFLFDNGNTILVTATHVYRTFGVEQVIVNAEGTGNVAAFYDLPSDDKVTLRSNLVTFEGGGYHIETQGFQKANIYPVSGGKDQTIVYGENSSLIRFADNVVDRIDATSNYRIWNPKSVTAINADTTNNTVVFLNLRPGDEYESGLTYVSATNAQRSVFYEALGFDHVTIRTLANGSNTVVVSMTTDSRTEMQDGQIVLTDGQRYVVMPTEATYKFVSANDALRQSPLVVDENTVTASDITAKPEAVLDEVIEEPVWSITNDDLDDLLMQSLAYEQMRTNKAQADQPVDEETDLLKRFAQAMALLQWQQ